MPSTYFEFFFCGQIRFPSQSNSNSLVLKSESELLDQRWEIKYTCADPVSIGSRRQIRPG